MRNWIGILLAGAAVMNMYGEVTSVQVRNLDDFMSPPILRMDSQDRIAINFDILGDQHEYLRYRIIHCNADGQPSRLMESEFVGGFNEGMIDDYAYSANTYIHYVNYNIELPNPEMPILASGDYLLEVYPETDPDDVILTVPFSVTENKVFVDGIATSRTDRGYNSEYQQLNLQIDATSLGRINPYQDLIVTVMQNNRPETLRRVEHPMRVEGSKVDYEHIQDLIFEAGNEYRRFETVRADYPGMRVDSVKFIDDMWHAWLVPDQSRVESNYIYDSTQHGRFMIDEYNSSDPDLAADYIMVHFTLDAPQLSGGAIYLDGDFTSHRFDDFNLMRYDWRDGLYHAELPLKQGSYNYQYVVVPEGAPSSYPSPIEGNKYETRNEYLVRVYLREPGSRGDRLVGHAVINFN
ncbi:MAG: DUF5103 domain-containing protein [Muribaculaceae bacterium]|nr:DUF5103 domain-containing protein [Muribaculaceae bacterium]